MRRTNERKDGLERGGLECVECSSFLSLSLSLSLIHTLVVPYVSSLGPGERESLLSLRCWQWTDPIITSVPRHSSFFSMKIIFDYNLIKNLSSSQLWQRSSITGRTVLLLIVMITGTSSREDTHRSVIVVRVEDTVRRSRSKQWVRITKKTTSTRHGQGAFIRATKQIGIGTRFGKDRGHFGTARFFSRCWGPRWTRRCVQWRKNGGITQRRDRCQRHVWFVMRCSSFDRR